MLALGHRYRQYFHLGSCVRSWTDWPLRFCIDRIDRSCIAPAHGMHESLHCSTIASCYRPCQIDVLKYWNKINALHRASFFVHNSWLTFIVKAVRNLMANDNTNAAVVQGFRKISTIKQWLQYASWEDCDAKQTKYGHYTTLVNCDNITRNTYQYHFYSDCKRRSQRPALLSTCPCPLASLTFAYSFGRPNVKCWTHSGWTLCPQLLTACKENIL